MIKKGENKVYVWSGNGYMLETITTNEESMSVEDLAYIVIKSGKGLFIPYSKMDNEDLELFEEYGYLESYAYCDMSEYDLENGFLLVENLKCDGVEIHS